MTFYFKRLIRLFFFGNFFISSGAVALVYCTSFELSIKKIPSAYIALVFFSTLFIYNLQRFFITKSTIPLFDNERKQWIQKNKNTVGGIILLSGIATAIFYFYIPQPVFVPLLPLFIISLTYFLPPFNLRKRPWAKTFVLALVWTGTTAFLPIVLAGLSLSNIVTVLHLLSRFFFMTSICMVFDLRDLETDKKEGANTIALIFGEQKTVLFALLFMLLHAVCVSIEYATNSIPGGIAGALILSAFVNGVVVALSNQKRGEFFFIAGIDGTIIIQWLCLLVVTIS